MISIEYKQERDRVVREELLRCAQALASCALARRCHLRTSCTAAATATGAHTGGRWGSQLYAPHTDSPPLTPSPKPSCTNPASLNFCISSAGISTFAPNKPRRDSQTEHSILMPQALCSWGKNQNISMPFLPLLLCMTKFMAVQTKNSNTKIFSGLTADTH